MDMGNKWLTHTFSAVCIQILLSWHSYCKNLKRVYSAFRSLDTSQVYMNAICWFYSQSEVTSSPNPFFEYSFTLLYSYQYFDMITNKLIQIQNHSIT